MKIEKSPKETIAEIAEDWFMYEPLLFNIYCTHKLTENEDMNCSFRVGKRRLEYNPQILNEMSKSGIEKKMKIEILRILLKHPYQRVPSNPNRNALSRASDITINETSGYEGLNLLSAEYYDLPSNLAYEEYYKKLSLICEDEKSGFGGEEKYFDKCELWDEDEELCDTINGQIEKAQKTNQWGSVSGTLQELINASVKIPMDYRKMLSHFRSSIISERRKLTRMKPNRRYDFDYMGSTFEPKTKLLVAVDVSGSVQNEDLQHFLSIINRFFSYGVEFIRIITFDVGIQQEYDLKKARKEIKIIGRGGTEFQPVFDYYESHSEYQALIMFTDGYAALPKLSKRKKALWVLTGKNEYDYAITWIKDLPDHKATWIPSVSAA